MVNLIASEHRHIGTRPGILSIDGEQVGRVSEEMFCQHIKETINGTGRTLSEMIRSSRAGNATGSGVFAVINADALSDGALRWLLASAKAIEIEAIAETLPLQLVVEGRFGVETLTSGPNSEFPLPQVIPEEFSQKGQAAFVRARLRRAGGDCDDASIGRLWELTGGDKYLTQALACQLISQQCLAVRRRHVDRAAEALASDPDDSLIRSVATGMSAMSLAEDTGCLRLPVELAPDWDAVDVAVKARCYAFGLVRRLSESRVTSRAPLLDQLLTKNKQLAAIVTEAIHTHMPLEVIASADQSDYLETRQRIVAGAWRGTLLSLHVGVGTRVNDSEVSLDMFSIPDGHYRACLALDPRVLKGTPTVWVCMWSSFDGAGGVSTVRTWRLAEISRRKSWRRRGNR